MMLNELLYKFSEPNPAFASKLKDENGKLLPTVIVYSDYTYEDIFQCSKCHKVIKSDDFPEGTYLESIEWD